MSTLKCQMMDDFVFCIHHTQYNIWQQWQYIACPAMVRYVVLETFKYKKVKTNQKGLKLTNNWRFLMSDLNITASVPPCDWGQRDKDRNGNSSKRKLCASINRKLFSPAPRRTQYTWAKCHSAGFRHVKEITFSPAIHDLQSYSISLTAHHTIPWRLHSWGEVRMNRK